MRYLKIKTARWLILILMLIVCMSGINLSLKSSAKALRSINPPMLAPASSLTPTEPSTNGKIAFASMRDGNAEIYVMNADGSLQVNLTKNPARDLNPAWSPDGTKITFTTNRDGRLEIYLMNADGSGQVRLTNSSGGNFDQHWPTLNHTGQL